MNPETPETTLAGEPRTADSDRLPLPDTGFWGGTATLGLSALIIFSVIVAQIVGAATLGLFMDFSVRDLFDDYGGLGSVGRDVDVSMFLYWVGAFAGLFVMLKFVRQRGFMGAPEYLGLVPTRHLALAAWLGVLVVFYGLFVLLPEVMMAENGHGNGLRGGGTFLYFVTAVTIAPIFEEALFRGFMFAGLAGSRIGLLGAILLTNTLWTLVHFQPAVSWFNEIYGLGVLFGAGLIFTLARIRTGSLIAPVVLHAAWNATMLLVDAAYLSKL